MAKLPLLKEGTKVHIDTDHEEWGRVACDAKVLTDFGRNVLVLAESVRANILVPKEDVSLREETESLWPVEIEETAGRMLAESKAERILEMSFDHTAAMISLLCQESDQLKAESPNHVVYAAARNVLRGQVMRLKDALENLKDGKGTKLVIFQRKCQEFGL